MTTTERLTEWILWYYRVMGFMPKKIKARYTAVVTILHEVRQIANADMFQRLTHFMGIPIEVVALDGDDDFLLLPQPASGEKTQGGTDGV